jgi:RNA polymerase sigma-70 factor (ECF subfamily)
MPEKSQVDWKLVVDQIERRDPAGEETLYANLLSGARIFLQRRLGTSDVDDRVHDVFLTVVDTIRRGELRDPERLMGFVRTVLHRQLSLGISQSVRRRETTTPIETTPQLPGSDATPEQQVLAQEKIAIMKQLLRQLSDRDFEVLSRSYLREQRQEQICEDLRLTPTQFQLLKSRAKARLAELVQRKLARKPLNPG